MRNAAASERVIFVDDDDSIARVARQLLERAGFDVEVVHSGREALDRLAVSTDGWAAVVTDQTMPGMTGIELAERIRGMAPRLPVVLCTGYGDSMDMHELAAAGVTELIRKPWTGATLASALRRIITKANRAEAAWVGI